MDGTIEVVGAVDGISVGLTVGEFVVGGLYGSLAEYSRKSKRSVASPS